MATAVEQLSEASERIAAIAPQALEEADQVRQARAQLAIESILSSARTAAVKAEEADIMENASPEFLAARAAAEAEPIVAPAMNHARPWEHKDLRDMLRVAPDMPAFEEAPMGWWGRARAYVIALLPRMAGGSGKSVVGDGGEASKPLPCTDLGNAERLVRRTKGKLIYVHGLQWLWWDGQRWLADSRERAIVEAKTVARDIFKEAYTANDPDLRPQLSKWAVRSEASGQINAMVKLARSADALRHDVDELDRHDDLLNTQNGTLDFTTFELSKHNPKQLLTRICNAKFDPNATCKFWEETVGLFLPDKDYRQWIQKAFGYSLLGSYSEYLFIPWGSGENGKSTILDAVRYALGDYAMEAPTDLLIRKRGDRSAGDESGIASLRGARLVTTMESEKGKALDEAFMKRLSGEGTIRAKLMRMDHIEFQNKAAIWLVTNHKPHIQGTDHGTWRRIALAPFNETLVNHKRLEQAAVKEKLHAGADGVLRWLVDGLRMYQEAGSLLPFPKQVEEATAKYRKDMDNFAEWMHDVCTERSELKVSVTTLRESYQARCDGAGYTAISGIDFNARLEELGFKRKIARIDGGKPQKCWIGLALSN